MIPAFSACTASPEPGISTSDDRVGDREHADLALAGADRLEEDDVLAGGAEQSSVCSVAAASPPAWPREPIERMKTPGSRKCSASRMRSPSSAPSLNGLVGSTEITADRLARARAPPRRAPRSASTCRRPAAR